MTATPWCKTPSGARSLLAFLITFLTIPAFSQTPIFPQLPLDFALFPSSTAAYADFNGDGQVDEASPNGINAIGISFNNGANHSPTFSTIQLTCQPQSVVAADLNNDNKVDLAFSCQTPNQPAYVGVVLGNGDGTFQAASYYAVPGAPSVPVLTAVDLNGDGYLDVAVLSGTSQVGVLLNQGSSKPGSLLTASLYAAPTGVSLLYISSGDFNGDGKQDIVAGNTQIAVYYGKGDGTLNTPQLTTASTPDSEAFVTGDYNRDGLTDIAFLGSPVESAPTSLQILLGDPSGKLVTGSNLPLDPSVNYRWIVPFQNTSTSNITNFALIGNVTSIALNDGSGDLSLGESYGVSTYAVAQAGSNGDTNLYFQSDVESVTLVGNGNGTFQGPRATLLGGGFGAILSADLNADGLADVLSIDAAGNLVAALGRGNGTFTVSSRSGTAAATGLFLVTGDFNGDGKLDALTIFPGVINNQDGEILSTASLYFCAGNGDGTFQSYTSPVNLAISAAQPPLVGTLTGTTNLTLCSLHGTTVIEGPQPPTGVLFFAGNGNGTFATPVSLPLPYTSIRFAADLNNDQKLDIIGGTTVSLGNGDGTFVQQPLGISGTILAVSDLNGDGNLDLMTSNGLTVGIYAGNGDGTFQSTPFYTTTDFSTNSGVGPFIAIGDVNADGHPDLLLQYLNFPAPHLPVLLGDGAAKFTPDQNEYSLGNAQTNSNGIATVARLNNQAPMGSADHSLDYLYGTNGVVTSLLNQNNPAPLAPAPIASKTVLSATAGSAAPGQQLTIAATVTGASPTGTVSFVAGGKTLGTAPLTNGTATLAVSFPAVGTFAVIANYPGDRNNTPSSSYPLSLAIAPVASKTTLAISSANAGTNQQLTFTATVAGLNPTGKVTFASATTTLGTASITDGLATLPFAFTTSGHLCRHGNLRGRRRQPGQRLHTSHSHGRSAGLHHHRLPVLRNHQGRTVRNDHTHRYSNRRLHRHGQVLLRHAAHRGQPAPLLRPPLPQPAAWPPAL